MTDTSHDYDAVIIGSGVIGCATALELARRGWRTLSVDKAPSAGSGSTINSCAIIRFSYSTVEGVLLSWEGQQYWANWADYIGADDELGLVDFHQCGQLLIRTGKDDHTERVAELWRDLDIPFETWGLDDFEKNLPILDLGLFGPPKRPDDEHFWDDAHGSIAGGYYTPGAGYISDPQLSCHNLQRGAEAEGGEFWFNAEVTSINSVDGRTTGNHAGRRPRSRCTRCGERCGTAQLSHQPDGRRFRLDEHQDQGSTTRSAPRSSARRISISWQTVWSRLMTTSASTSGQRPATTFSSAAQTPVATSASSSTLTTTTSRSRSRSGRPRYFGPTGECLASACPHDKKGVVDLYDVSDDWLPIYDKTDLEGFYVAIGTSGNQYKNAGCRGTHDGRAHQRRRSRPRPRCRPACREGRVHRLRSRHWLLQPQPRDQSRLFDVSARVSPLPDTVVQGPPAFGWAVLPQVE